jgi:hypothetical protein
MVLRDSVVAFIGASFVLAVFGAAGAVASEAPRIAVQCGRALLL